MLELSGMEREGFSLEFAPVNLKEVMNDALRTVSGNMERKKMKLSLEMPNEVIIEGDAERLIQVMVNLLSNAITYSKEEKTITVSVTRIKGNRID